MIYIVPDSNVFYQTSFSSFDKFSFNKSFEELIDIIKRCNLKNGIKILVPEIVIEELKKRKLEDYQKNINTLKALANSLGIYASIKVNKNANEYRYELSKQIDDYMKEYPQVRIMPICKSGYFKAILDKAIDKKPPFEGKEKQSDKGFKDTVIYYSMIDYAKQCLGDYYFLTKDKRFTGEGYDLLRNEFKKKTHLNLRIFDDIKALEHEVTTSLPDVKMKKAIVGHKNTELMLGFGEMIIIPFDEVIVQGNDKNIARINVDIQRIYTYKKIRWNEQFDSYVDERELFEGEVTTEISYNQNGILSLKIKEYTYLGGPHGNRELVSRTYCLDTGEIMPLTEILQKDEKAILQLVVDKWNEYKLHQEYANCYPDFSIQYEDIDEIKYYINEDGVMVYFDEYEAGPYSAGIIEFLLAPIEEVNGYTIC